MPHLTIEHSANLSSFPVDAFLVAVNSSLCASGEVRQEADLKTRVVPVEQVRIGIAGAPRGFVYAQLRLLAGRSAEAKKDLSTRIADALRTHCPRPLGMEVQISVEIVDMDPASYTKDLLVAPRPSL